MKKNIIILLIIIIIVAIVFAVSKSRRVAENKIVVIKKEDNRKNIDLALNSLLELDLEVAGATGYDWYINSLDTDHLQLISEETKSSAPPDLVGAPVVKIWKFKALKSGKSNVSLDYYRVWEGKEKSIDHFSVSLTIE